MFYVQSRVLLCSSVVVLECSCVQARVLLCSTIKCSLLLGGGVTPRALLCSTIKCSLLPGGGITQYVNVIWVGDEGNGARVLKGGL